MSEVWRLFQLQKADTRLTELDKALAALRADDQHQRLLADAEAAHAAAEAELRRLKKELRELEHEDSTLRDKAKVLDKKLYGGRVTNLKELTGYEEELKAIRGQVDKLETLILERMEDVETREEGLRGLQARILEARQDRDQRQVALDDKIARLESEYTGYRERRQEQAREVGATLLKRYEDLKARKNGVAVARIANHSCEGCRMHLTDHKIQEAKGSGITFCATCSRILYLEG